ncbi:MAG: hypothetical protein ACRD11_07800 [Terriglobia bacterium]
MKRSNLRRWLLTLAALALLPVLGYGRNAGMPDFLYAGGTAPLQSGCSGTLGVSHASMTFECAQGSVTIPYSSITLMQYRPKLSRKVRRMKLRWKVRPTESASKKNLLFTVLYRDGDTTQALVLRVLPDEMRPYLAEIELNTGKRIEVWDYRGFD